MSGCHFFSNRYFYGFSSILMKLAHVLCINMHKTVEQILEILILKLLPPVVTFVSFGGQTRFILSGSIFPQIFNSPALSGETSDRIQKIGECKKWY